ncbi:MAG: phosphoadenylyl-sulfate reductase [Acidimicrobiales bacterium]
MSAPTATLANELDAVNARFETAAPREVLAWVFERFGDDVVMACSFEDLALLHMVHQARPGLEVIFLDTGGHFPETLEFAARVEREWSLNLTRTTPGPAADPWPCGTERCCELRKVEPLRRAVAGRAAWITALKRVDAPSRAATRIVGWDERFHLVKVNPLATWRDDDVAYYLRANDLPEHPLWAQGYASIGCAPVTVPPAVSGDRRSGRWVGADQEECGLHEA